MMSEAGEVADVIQKHGDDAIMQGRKTCRSFIEEMCGVMMYFNDVLLRYGIAPGKLEQATAKSTRGIGNDGRACKAYGAMYGPRTGCAYAGRCNESAAGD